MGVASSNGFIKYVFTQAVAPSGEGEVEGSLWYDTATNLLKVYDGATWTSMAPTGISSGHITILPYSYNAINQGTWAFTTDASYMTSGVFYNTSQASGDSLTFKVYLAKGTYTFMSTTSSSGAGGILKANLGVTLIASHDTYTGGAGRQVTANIAVATDGLYDLTIFSNTKHGSSSGYYMQIHYLALWRTA
jgi:hypothetical protein